MGWERAFQVEGQVVEARSNGTFWVELSNGHRLTGFVTGRGKKDFAGIKTGDKVKLRLTPYDLSMGRIVTENKTI
jgi:translation initiation factor IF-1